MSLVFHSGPPSAFPLDTRDNTVITPHLDSMGCAYLEHRWQRAASPHALHQSLARWIESNSQMAFLGVVPGDIHGRDKHREVLPSDLTLYWGGR